MNFIKPLAYIVIGLILVWIFISQGLGLPQYTWLVILAVIIPLLFIRPAIGIIVLIFIRNSIDLFDILPILSIGSLDLNLASLMGLLIIPWGLIRGYKELRQQGYTLRTTFKIPLVKLWMLFLLISAISLIFSINFTESLTVIIKLINFFILYLLSFLLVPKLGLQKYLKLIMLSLILPGILGLYQLLSKTGTSFVADNIVNRLNGTFAHPNALAFALLIGIAVFLILITIKKNLPIKWSILAGLYFILLVFTFTRSAWIGVVIMLGLWLVFNKKKLLFPSLILGVLLIISFPFVNSYFSNSYNINLTQNQVATRLEPETDSSSGSLLWRQRTWLETIPAIWQAPIIGHGIGTFPYVRQDFVGFESDLGALEAHNDYLRLAIEIGFAGLLIYILIYLRLIKLSLNTAKKHTDRAYLKAFIALVITIMIMSFADNVLRNAPVQWMLWSLAGAMMASSNQLSKYSSH